MLLYAVVLEIILRFIAEHRNCLPATMLSRVESICGIICLRTVQGIEMFHSTDK